MCLLVFVVLFSNSRITVPYVCVSYIADREDVSWRFDDNVDMRYVRIQSPASKKLKVGQIDTFLRAK